MEQYIPKAAVVAEIERIMAEEMSLFKDCYEDELENTSSSVVYMRMKMLLSFLNTLEVKEVGLDLGSPDGDMSVKTVWDGDKIVSSKAQKGE